MNLFFSSTIFAFGGALTGSALAHYACNPVPANATHLAVPTTTLPIGGVHSNSSNNSSHDQVLNGTYDHNFLVPDVCAGIGSSVGSIIGLGISLVLFSVF